MRLGDLDDLKVHISELLLVYSGAELATAILNAIDNAPTVEYTFEEAFKKTVCEQRLYCPARPKGEWKEVQQSGWNEIQSGLLVCPFCGATPHKQYKNYCSNCGADMRGEVGNNGKAD